MSFRLRPEQDALFLDIDGTLLDIAPTPDGVVIPEHLLENLARLHKQQNGAVAFISGRSLDDIDALFSPLRLPASGVHGAQWRIETENEERRPLPEMLRSEIHKAFAEYPALILEDKKYAVAVHYRQAPVMAETVENLLKKIVSRSGEYFSVMRGKMVFEVVYPGHHKGTAIERFMKHKPFAGRRPVFLGDDETDVFAIKACQKMGGIGVRIGGFEEPLSSPSDVREWLAQQ